MKVYCVIYETLTYSCDSTEEKLEMIFLTLSEAIKYCNKRLSEGAFGSFWIQLWEVGADKNPVTLYGKFHGNWEEV